ncbi:hypothetical protein ACNQFN_11130 [Thauera butanivorans]|uniref:hypothetical protein n=1 Tax=Thauera butanivorans TaxID=86174 RepID=UPI003AB78DFF
MNLTADFGEAADSPRMEEIFRQLNTLRRPQLPDDDPYIFYDWVLVRRQGLELGFVEENYHLGKAKHLWGTGQLLFVQAYYYAGFDDVQCCEILMPYGLSWKDSREKVRGRMAGAAATLHSSSISDTWDVPEGYRLTVTYGGNPIHAERMVCQQVPVPLRPSQPVSPPNLDQIIVHWGHSVTQTDWRALWSHWLDDNAIKQGSDSGEIDLADSFGVTLHVEPDDGAPLLRAITLHGNRDANAVGWRGKLPQGLDFEDSPNILFQKIQEQPISTSQGKITGHAVWNFHDYTLHVLYSCVDNRLMRVKLIAPGIWKPIEDY